MRGHSDEGIILYRKMLKDNLRQMQLGQEPLNVFRDPAEAACIEIVTERDKIAQQRQGRACTHKLDP